MATLVSTILQKLSAALDSPAPVILFADEQAPVDTLFALFEDKFAQGERAIRRLVFGAAGVMPDALSFQSLCADGVSALWIEHRLGLGADAERARSATVRALEAAYLVEGVQSRPERLVLVLPVLWNGIVPMLAPCFFRQCLVLELPAPILSAAEKRDRDRQAFADMAASHGMTVGKLAGRAKASVKFIDPNDDTRRWSGRGTAPAWYKAYVALHGGDEGLRVLNTGALTLKARLTCLGISSARLI